MESSQVSQASEYYQQLGHWSVSDGMKNFDDPQHYEDFAKLVASARSRNFVLDFDDDNAWCGFDLDPEALSVLLQHDRPPQLNTRWINIWLPSDQKQSLEVIAKHYDFTPRLLGFMQAMPLKIPRSRHSSGRTSVASLFKRSNKLPPTMDSEEKGLGRDSPSNSMDPGFNSQELLGMVKSDGSSAFSEVGDNLNPYFLANEIWHYSSIDWGRRYLSIGYNTIHNIPEKGGAESSNTDPRHSDRPMGKRVWTWLILCEDRTVISINEDPFPSSNGLLTHQQQLHLGIIRRNLINTFKQLSKARDSSHDPSQMRLPLRIRLGETEDETRHRATDVPGMLFYYLFDDWLNTYSLIARREHPYAGKLNTLRAQMMHRAQLAHIEQLHHIGRQLGVLKRLYQSYEMLIDRILEPQRASLASLENSRLESSRLNTDASAFPDASAAHLDDRSRLGVPLSSASAARFAGLKVRISLYALAEIADCLAQKDNLVMLNLNLIAIKESLTVERLTRFTLLLAKLTLVFMPVSVMSAYFGCDFADAQFDVASYWAWFAGVLAASLLALLLFDLLTGAADGAVPYRSVGKVVRKWFGRFPRTGGTENGENSETHVF